MVLDVVEHLVNDDHRTPACAPIVSFMPRSVNSHPRAEWQQPLAVLNFPGQSRAEAEGRSPTVSSRRQWARAHPIADLQHAAKGFSDLDFRARP